MSDAEGQNDFAVRIAAPADATIIAWQRACMWRDMGDLPNELFEQLRASSEDYLQRALNSGEYVGWLAAPVASPETIAAGAGVVLREVMPHPMRGGDATTRIAQGRDGRIVNVFTEPEWRRRGLAQLLLRHIIAWARAERLERLTLHASAAGRALYEKLGFLATNEMRLPL